MNKIAVGLYWSVDWHHMEVTKVFKNGKCQITETWIAEDTGKSCKSVDNYGIGTDGNEQYAYALDYPAYKLYASGAFNWTPEMETKEENEMTDPNKYTGEFTFEGRTYETNAKGNYFYVTDIEAGYCRKRIGREAYEKAFEQFTALEKTSKLDAGMEKLGYSRIESEIHPDYFTYSTCDGQSKVMSFQTVEEGLKWVAEQTKDEEPAKEEKKAEKKTKKAAKPRKSKDIAHDSNGVTLTTKQVEFLKALPKCSFWENGLDSGLWCDCIAEDIGWNPMSVGAMVSTLREKDLVVVIPQKVNNKKCKSMEFTELGKKVAKELGLA